MAMAVGRIADHTGLLLPAERTGVERMGDARAAEYSSGRRVAREALRLLGIEDWPVAVRGRVPGDTWGRAPLWPEGVVGTITHSRTLSLALVVHRARLVGVGADLETGNRVSERVAERVLNERERARQRARQQAHLDEPDWRTLLFSAKESVYKAVNPVAGEFLGFEDVEIAAAAGEFTATTTRACASTAWAAAGKGHFLRTHGHWLTIFLLPG